MLDWLVGAVGNWVKSWTSKPAAPKPKPGPAPIKVTTNKGMQGSTYNPQRTYNPQYTAPTSYHQPARRTQYYQPAASTYAVQAAQRAARAVAAQRAAAAEDARQHAIRVEKARQERLRVIRVKTAQHQGRLNVYSNKFKGSVTVAKARNYIMSLAGRKGHWSEYLTADGKLIGGDKYNEKTAPTRVRNAYAQLQKALTGGDNFYNPDGTINQKALAEMEKAVKSKFRLTAHDMIEQRKGKNIWDEIAGRGAAQKNQGDLQYNWQHYERRIKSFEKQQAQWKQKHLEAKNAGNVDAANSIADQFNNWYSKEVRGLVRQGAGLQGLSQGYGKEADAPYKTRYGGFINKLHDTAKGVGDVAGGIFKYTIGQGDKNIPSLITAPTRAVNLIRNLNGNSGKTLNYHDPMHTEGVAKGSLFEKWQQTYMQRAGNAIHPNNFVPTKQKGMAFSFSDKMRRADQRWNQAITGNKVTNYLGEFTADLGAAGALKFLPKGAKALNRGGSKLADKYISDKFYDNLVNSKLGRGVKWMGQEMKTPARAGGDKIHERLQPFYASAKVQAGSIKRSFATWKENQVRFNKTIKQQREEYKGQLHNRFAKLDERVVYLAQNLVRQHQLGKSYKAMPWKAQLPVKKSIRGLPSLFKGEYPAVNMKGLTREQNKQALELRDWLLETSGSLYSKERGLGTAMKNWYKGRGQYNRETAKGLRYRRQEGYIANKAYGASKKKKDDPDFSISFLKKSKGGRFQNPERLSRSIANRYYQSKRWQNQYIDNPKFFGAMKDKSARFEETSNVINTVQKENVPNLKNLLSNVARGTGRWGRKSKIDKLGFAGNALKQDILPLPRRVWTASTLALRPAWYLNNAVYNEMAGALSAGPRFFAEQAKLMRKGKLTAARQANPEVVSNISKYHDGGWMFRGAKAIEDNARLAAFNTLKKKGLSDKKSLKRTNDYLLDYTTKNWERPIKTVLPFWAWTKGINKATVRMPFDRPGAALGLNAYDEKTQRELSKIPEDQRKFFDRGMYWGKDKKGNPQFLNAPWLPFSTAGSKNVGVNPYLAASSELLNNKDFYGNPLENKHFLATLASKFPQYNVINDIMRSGYSTVKELSERGKDGFALTKDKKIDDNERGLKTLKSFIGWNDPRSFDWDKHRKYKHEGRFRDEWFKRDWEKEFPESAYPDSNAAYEAKRSAQEALAKKYGYDLQKDVYNGIFTRNDSEVTKHIKMLKDQAAKFGDEFWAEYKAQPYGTRSRWANEKMKEIAASGKLGRNSYIGSRLPKWHSAENAIKYSKPSTAVQYKGKWFKSADSLARYKKYEQYTTTGYWKDGKRFKSEDSYNRYQRFLAYKSGDWSKASTGKRQSPHQFEGKFFKSKESMEKYKEGKFWKEYYATTDFTERQKMLDKNPQYRNPDFKLPQTDEEWDAFKSARKKKQFAALSSIPSWMQAYEKHKAATPTRVKFSATKKIVWKG